MAAGNAPTLINLPPPPADPVTPSDMGPGTPNSGTTTMSELSTVAIKDGHRGHGPHAHDSNDAQRADRIGRLAGLERVATARSANLSASSQPAPPQSQTTPTQPVGYFDASNNPAIMRERSTVGSASATGSVGGRTTWASGSVSEGDPERMSEADTAEGERDTDMMDTGSTGTGGFSDDASASLVGFGEGARTPARQHSLLGSPTTAGKPAVPFGAPGASAVPAHMRSQGSESMGQLSPSTGDRSSNATPASVEQARQEARMIDGMSYDADVVDTAHQPPPSAADLQSRRNLSTADNAERVVRERAAARGELGDTEMRD